MGENNCIQFFCDATPGAVPLLQSLSYSDFLTPEKSVYPYFEFRRRLKT